MRNSKNRAKKIFFVFFGLISFSLGAIGIIIPGLPTTPFMILSSILFLNSSDKLYSWLTAHEKFGKYVVDFKKGKGITFKTKLYAQTNMQFTMTKTIIPISPAKKNTKTTKTKTNKTKKNKKNFLNFILTLTHT